MSNTIPYTLSSIMILASMLLVGCDASDASNTEVVSPTGCLKSQGRYYDPKLKECVQVDDKHQARVLNEYRYVNQLAEEGELEEVEYLIILRKFSTIEKTEELWSFLRERKASLRYFAGSLPADRTYDDPSGEPIVFQDTKIWDNGGESCGWHEMSIKKTDEMTIPSLIESGVQAREKEIFGYPLPERRKAIFEDGDCRIIHMSVTAKPGVIRDFWNAHLDDIEAIQPQVTSVDKLQPTLFPVQPILKEE